jgi:hypothetical protein
MSGVHCQRFPDCMELAAGNEMPRCAKLDCPGNQPSELMRAMFASPGGAAQRAYGLLWRDPAPSMFSRDARQQLFGALSHEERRAGTAWAMEHYGPMTQNEMIAADMRVGVFPEKSTEHR